VKTFVYLYPPLNNAAGKSRVEIALDDKNTIAGVIDELAKQFGPEFCKLLFDDRGLIIPGWCARINQQPPLHFNQPDALATEISDGDEISLLLALAGG
jgi:molybdopterin converting factor small subunit